LPAVEDIAVIGAGSYGTCLAICFARVGHRVTFYCRKPEVAAAMQASRETSYLPGHKLPDNISVTADLEHAVRGRRFVVGVTPSHGIRDVLGTAAQWIDPDAIVINASKGLEEVSHATIDRIYAEIFPRRIAERATYLSGPTFAGEIAAGMPAAIVLAGRDPTT
jgi:glycerol-3-phosphate dehydrogenase (NAD(P)+)